MIEETPAAEYSLGALGIRGFAVNENDEIDLTQNVGRAKLGIDVANSRTYRDRRRRFSAVLNDPISGRRPE